MTLELEIADVGRDTVSLSWKRAWNDPGAPSSYHVFRCEPPAALERIGNVVGATAGARKFIDPACQPSTTYVYEVVTVGINPPESDSMTVTTRPPTEFTDGDDFFDNYLSAVFARDTEQDSINWCPRWREHREAVVVVNELWRSYEAHRPPDDPTTPTTERAVWFTVFGYPLMERLFNPQGGFHGCYLKDGTGGLLDGHGGPQPSLPG